MDNVPQNAAAVSSEAPAVNSYLSSDAGQAAALVNDIYTQMAGIRDYDNAWSAAEAAKQREWSSSEAEKTRAFNSYEAQKNRDWQEAMSNSAHQREMADLQAAGLNPVLSALNGNGASVTSGATASASSPSGASASGNQNTGMAIASILGTIIGQQTKLEEQRLNAELNRELTDRQIAANEFLAMLSNETSRANAQTAAGAQMYASDNANEASHYSSDQANEASHYSSQKQYEANTYNTMQNALSAAAQRRLTESENEKNREHDEYMTETYPQTNAGIISTVANGVSGMLQDGASLWQQAMKYIDEHTLIGDIFNDMVYAFTR